MPPSTYRPILIWLLACAAVPCPAQSTCELIRDPHFRCGFSVLSPVHGRKVVVGKLAVAPDAEPIWQLAQWHSRFTIAGAEPGGPCSGTIRYSNPAKTIAIGDPNTADADITLAIDSVREYDGRLRKEGQPWPHLLVEQAIDGCPNLAELARLDFHIEARLRYNVRIEPPGYSTGLHCAQVPFVLTVANVNPQSAGRGDFLWFVVPIYDDRRPHPSPHIAEDTADPSAKLIYNPGSLAYTRESLHSGRWLAMDTDLLPHIHKALETAWSRGYLPDSRDSADYRITSTNLGWEAPGLNQSSIQIRNLSLRATTR